MKLLVNHRLAAFHQKFNWALAGLSKFSVDKMIGLQSQVTAWAVPWVSRDITKKLLHSQFFSKWMNYKTTYSKKIHCALDKAGLYF